jgi:hypothetical protein
MKAFIGAQSSTHKPGCGLDGGRVESKQGRNKHVGAEAREGKASWSGGIILLFDFFCAISSRVWNYIWIDWKNGSIIKSLLHAKNLKGPYLTEVVVLACWNI